MQVGSTVPSSDIFSMASPSFKIIPYAIMKLQDAGLFCKKQPAVERMSARPKRMTGHGQRLSVDAHGSPFLYQKQPAAVIHTVTPQSAAKSTVEPHDHGNGPVNLLCGLFFVRLDVARRIRPDENIVHHPAKDRMSAMGDAFLEDELHKFLGRRAHVLEALPERNHSESHFSQVLNHLDGAPPVEGNLPDVVLLPQVIYEFFNKSIVDDIAFRCLEVSLLFPHVIGHMIPLHTKVNRILRHPEIGKDLVFVVFVLRRKHKDEGRDIRGRGKV